MYGSKEEMMGQFKAKLRKFGIGLLKSWDEHPDGMIVRIRVSEKKLLSERILKTALNIFGNDLSLILFGRTYGYGEPLWILQKVKPHKHVIEILLIGDETNFFHHHFTTLIDFLQIALSFEEEPNRNHPLVNDPGINGIVHMVSSHDELRALYKQWIINAIQWDFDKQHECDSRLYRYELCCFQHIVARLQQYAFLQWFEYINEYGETNLTADYEVDEYEQQESADYISAYIQPYKSIVTFVTKYDEWTTHEQSNDSKFDECVHDAWLYDVCCPTHISLFITTKMFKHFIYMLEELYQIYQRVYDYDLYPGNQNWLVEVIEQETLNPYPLLGK